MLLYKMTEIATRTHNFEEAIKLYREFVKAAPHDQSRYILKYQIYRERGSSLDDQIKTLKEYKTHEYQEKWAYELASLYDQAGMQEDCVRECDELILWFSEGEYVTKAMELKMKYEPLTPVQQDKYDLDNFRKLYDLDEKYSDYPKVAAHVISSDGNWFNSFVIDKGSNDGLKVNMNVLAGDGLVGIVTEVNKSYARVRSIIDDESSVTGSFLKTSDMCFVNGNLKLINKGMIDISGIPADAEIKNGYEVVTSPVSDKYLPGILIGYARDIETDSSNITQSAHLTPAADFSGLDMVLVITEVKDSGDLEDILN